MLFNSLDFLIFGLLFFSFWPLAKRNQTVRFLYIIGCSCVFYGWWNPWFLILLATTGLTDFLVALAIEKYPKQKRELLALSIIANLSTLAVFKYSVFIAQNIAWLFGKETDWPGYVLPVGISFYTFQSLSYTIDVYRGDFKPTRNVLHFFTSICLFPHLVAGPIVRAADLLPQLLGTPNTTETLRWDGLKLIASGYFKKVVIADNLAPAVNAAFGAPTVLQSSAYWWLIVTLFALQIYCDFSGYTDIARGLAKWMGYEFTLNFTQPYFSASLREFWSRWHISLSSWFKDYVYIPLGGSKDGVVKSHRNMWITMLLSGFWHGANWRFIAWGALHAFYLSLERVVRWPERMAGSVPGRILAVFLVLIQVWVAWVFFRAESIGQALQVVKVMFSFSPGEVPVHHKYPVILCLGIGYELYQFTKRRIEASGAQWIYYGEPFRAAVLLVASVFLRGPGNAFIYFQF